MKTATKKTRLQERGSVLAFVLLTLVIFFLTGTGMLSLALHSQLQAIRTGAEITARSAADAGLATALFRMNEKLSAGSWNDSELPQLTDEPLPNAATYDFIVEKIDDVYTIKSTGTSGNRRAIRTVKANLRVAGLFDDGILAVGKIEMKNNNLVDGYNSETGDTDVEVQIGTISTEPGSIILGASTIDGKVFVGVDGDAETVIQSEGIINGGTYAISKEPELPIVTAPLLDDKGTINVPDTTTLILGSAANGKYSEITLDDSAILQIGDGTGSVDVVLHVAGNINLGNNSVIQVKPGSSLTLYVDGNIGDEYVNNAGINNETGIASNLKLYSTGTGEQVFHLKNNSGVFAAIYAPNADVIFKNNTELYGSIVAKSFTWKNNGTFYYDEALRDADLSDLGARFVISHWWEG